MTETMQGVCVEIAQRLNATAQALTHEADKFSELAEMLATTRDTHGLFAHLLDAAPIKWGETIGDLIRASKEAHQ